MVPKMFPSVSVLPLLWAAAARATETREWQFQMFLDDREMGQHRFAVQHEWQGTRALSEANAEVRVLAIPFFRYHHRSEEQWSQGCMSTIRARTEKNGDTSTVAGGRTERFDAVFIASHSDQALAMLADASPQEREVLGAIPYQRNEAVLHTDHRLPPRRRLAWASWNYHVLHQDRRL